MSIRPYGDSSSPYYYPAIDAGGNFVGETGDRNAAALPFSNVKILRNQVVVFESEDALDGRLYITDTRIVLMSEDYQSGGAFWIGGLAGAVIATAASELLARSRTAGTVLAGHIRYEWLDNVSATSDRYFLGLGDETLSITYGGMGSVGSVGSVGSARWRVIISLENSTGLAEKTRSEIMRRHELFQQGPGPGDVRSARAPLPLPASELAYCSQCGGQIGPSDPYCKHCGSKQ